MYHTGDYAGVVAVLSGADNKQPPDMFSMLWLGLSYHELGREAEALRCFSLGHSAPYLIQLGDQALADGSPAKAETWYTLAARADPGSAAKDAIAHYELGRCYPRQDALDPAAEAFNAAIRWGTDDYYLARAYEGLGDVYLAQGKPAEALAQYQRALALDPSNQTVAGKLGQWVLCVLALVLCTLIGLAQGNGSALFSLVLIALVGAGALLAYIVHKPGCTRRWLSSCSTARAFLFPARSPFPRPTCCWS